MRVLVYSANFAPETVGIGKYSGEMAAWLARQGHQVRVVCAPPYYPTWKLGAGYTWPPYRREQWQGVDVWRAPLWVPANPGGLKRVLHLITFAISSLPVMVWQLVWRPDVVLTVAPALVCAPTGWLVARLCGGKAWLHIQDFEVDVAFQMGLLKGRKLQAMVLGLERWLFRRFDVVSSISNSMVQRLVSKGVQPYKAVHFPNWVDLSHIQPLAKSSAYRKELGLTEGTRVALFSGTLGAKQGLMVIPEAARHLAHRTDILFVVCGDGALKAPMEEAASQLPNLKLLPLQPFERLGELLGLADMHVLPQSPEAEDLVLPSKLSGMLASGRPVIATCRPGTEIAIVVNECGMVVAPGDSQGLAHAIERLADNEEQCLALGRKARLHAQNLMASESILLRLQENLEKLVSEGQLGAVTQ